MNNKNYLSIYAKSFNWAGFFLPKNTLYKCSSLYDFCRTVDNIVDNDSEIISRKNNLLKFKNSFFKKDFKVSIIKNMWDLMDEFKISSIIVNDLFDGMETDLEEKVDFKSRDELLIYSYRVAGTVGLMMAKILNVTNLNALKSSIDLGIAMQLTNISRDVVEDAKINRHYISENFDSIQRTLNLADTFYKSSFASIKNIPLSFRFSILVARRVYKKIGDKIIKQKNFERYKKSGKIYVGNFGKLLQTILSILDLIKLIMIKSNDHLKTEEHFIISKVVNLNERF